VALRFITKDIHAYVIDYPIAVVLIVAPTTVSNETGMQFVDTGYIRQRARRPTDTKVSTIPLSSRLPLSSQLLYRSSQYIIESTRGNT
jgi:hypothetical protein